MTGAAPGLGAEARSDGSDSLALVPPGEPVEAVTASRVGA